MFIMHYLFLITMPIWGNNVAKWSIKQIEDDEDE